VRQSRSDFRARLEKADVDHDLCLLSVPGLKAPPAQRGESLHLQIGQAVYAIGSPEGLELTISEGLVSSIREHEKFRAIQTSAAISPGSSGGGLFDDTGHLIGITTFSMKDGQNLNFAVPVEWIPVNAQPVASSSRELSEVRDPAPSRKEPADEIDRAASVYNIPSELIRAVIAVESTGDTAAPSRKGRIGLMGLTRNIANDMFVDDPFDPAQNIMGGTRYLRYLANEFAGDMSSPRTTQARRQCASTRACHRTKIPGSS
jgi:hypothetical protein